MPRQNPKGKPAVQTRLKQDDDPPVELACVRNDADDKSEAGRPTTDHEAESWRAVPPSKP